MRSEKLLDYILIFSETERSARGLGIICKVCSRWCGVRTARASFSINVRRYGNVTVGETSRVNIAVRKHWGVRGHRSEAVGE